MSENFDPFTALEKAAVKQRLEEEAALAIARARTRLVLGKDAKSVWFATLALRMKAIPRWDVPTMATDGKDLFYNPEFTTQLPKDECVGVIAHEVMHNALAHPARRGDRDQMKWNIAADGAINPIIEGAGFKLPAGRLMPGEGILENIKPGLSAEEIYSQLPDPPEGCDGNDPGGCGGVIDPGDGSEAACRQAEAESKVAVAQATHAAQQRGELPAGIARLVDAVLNPRPDVAQVLREFVSRYAKNDYSWAVQNRRFIHQGLYLPGMRSEELGSVVLAVDTSGSVGEETLALFAQLIQGILEAYECELTILYHDAEVQAVEHWSPSDGPLLLNPVGGGGTDHRPVFDWIANQGDQPTCLVCLTDMYSVFPTAPPDYPVLWATVGGTSAPWGQVVEVQP